MNKFFGLIVAAMAAVAMSSPAQADVNSEVVALQRSTILEAQLFAGLNWKVGDKASYNIKVGTFINGKSDNFVREETDIGFWMQNDMDLTIQKAKVEILINKTNGQIEKLLVNGQEQSVPKQDVEIVDQHEDSVTVPAGTFDAIYVKIKDKADGKLSEVWINPKVMPMTGSLKSMQDSDYGKVMQEATSMYFAPR